MNNYCVALLCLLLFIIIYSLFSKKTNVKEKFHNYNLRKKKHPCCNKCSKCPCRCVIYKKRKKKRCNRNIMDTDTNEKDCENNCNKNLVCPPCEKCPAQCPDKCPDLSKYVLKSSIPPCPKCPDMSKYILKSEIPPPLKCPDMDKFVLKSSIPPCPQCQPCPEIKCGDCPKCPQIPKIPEIKQNLAKLLKENCPVCKESKSGINEMLPQKNYNNFENNYYTQKFNYESKSKNKHNNNKEDCGPSPFHNSEDNFLKVKDHTNEIQ